MKASELEHGLTWELDLKPHQQRVMAWAQIYNYLLWNAITRWREAQTQQAKALARGDWNRVLWWKHRQARLMTVRKALWARASAMHERLLLS